MLQFDVVTKTSITTVDYSSQLAQANDLILRLIEEVRAHASQNGIDLTAILSQLQLFQTSAINVLNALSDQAGIIKVSQDQIKELLSRIYSYLPSIGSEIADFKSATLLQLDTLGASISSVIIKEGDETQNLLSRILDQLQDDKEEMTIPDIKRIETGTTWKRLVIPAGLIQFVLGCTQNKENQEYFFQENGTELKLLEPGIRIHRTPQGGKKVYGAAVAELPPNSIWLFSYSSFRSVNVTVTEQDGRPVSDILVQVPAEIVS